MMKFITGPALLCVVLSVFLGCGESDDATRVDETALPTGAVSIGLLDMSGCKESLTGIPLATAPSSEDCVEWWYVGGHTLHLKHINAGFNCCPTVDVDIRVVGSTITVEEIEIEGLCHCLCLFDVDYEIENLPPGVYELVFIEPYLPPGDEVLGGALDLVSSPSGRLCVGRSQYPWGL
jgi:hypothetical protein